MTFQRTLEVPAELSPLLDRIRRLCLSLANTQETSSWGHPSFRAGNRTFVTFEQLEGSPSVAFHLCAADIERFEKAPGFHLTPYGRGAWISLKLTPRAKWSQLEHLVLRSYRSVAPNGATPATKKKRVPPNKSLERRRGP